MGTLVHVPRQPVRVWCSIEFRPKRGHARVVASMAQLTEELADAFERIPWQRGAGRLGKLPAGVLLAAERS